MTAAAAAPAFDATFEASPPVAFNNRRRVSDDNGDNNNATFNLGDTSGGSNGGGLNATFNVGGGDVDLNATFDVAGGGGLEGNESAKSSTDRLNNLGDVKHIAKMQEESEFCHRPFMRTLKIYFTPSIYFRFT